MKIKSGIYKLQSIIKLEMFYIGSSVHMRNRFNRHKSDLINNLHPNKILQNHVNKYGIDDIVFEVIEYIEDKECLIEVEQTYLDLLNPTFNIRTIANSNHGVKRTEEANIKSSINNSRYWKGKKRPIETCKRISEGRRGIKPQISEDMKIHLSECKRGNQHAKGTVRSEEHIAAIKLRHTNKKLSPETISKVLLGKLLNSSFSYTNIIQLTEDNIFIKEWRGIKKTANELNISFRHISNCCKGLRNLAGGYKWVYEKDYKNNQNNNI